MSDPLAPRQTLQLRLADIVHDTPRIARFVLEDEHLADLPPFTAGAHIEIHLAQGLKRAYSLCSDPAERRRYVVAVLRDDAGRGGSLAVHRLQPGALVTVSAPRNHFPLVGKEARTHLMLAGGIGVTPMMAMIAELERRGAPWTLHYCTRSLEETAFRAELAPFIAAGKVFLHHDGGDPARGLDIASLLLSYDIGTHLYFCGPPSFMAACQASIGAWPPHVVHREYFSAPLGGAATSNEAFQVRVRSTGKVLDIPPGASIADVLKANGCALETDCNEGYCGTCITRYVAGNVDHRDTVLSEAERKTYLMVCCSRSPGGLVELDL